MKKLLFIFSVLLTVQSFAQNLPSDKEIKQRLSEAMSQKNTYVLPVDNTYVAKKQILQTDFKIRPEVIFPMLNNVYMFEFYDSDVVVDLDEGEAYASEKVSLCHGFRIHKNWILTASHCIQTNEAYFAFVENTAKNYKTKNGVADYRIAFYNYDIDVNKVPGLMKAQVFHAFFKLGDNTDGFALIYLPTYGLKDFEKIKKYYPKEMSQNLKEDFVNAAKFFNTPVAPFKFLITNDIKEYEGKDFYSMYLFPSDIKNKEYKDAHRQYSYREVRALLVFEGSVEEGMSGAALFYGKETIAGVLIAVNQDLSYKNVYSPMFREPLKDFLKEVMGEDFYSLQFTNELK